MEGRYDAIDVAKWFVKRSEEAEMFQGGDKITLLKLLKLLYYAEGMSLARDEGSLFSDPFLAWEHGPVVRSVYDYYDNAYDVKYIAEQDDADIAKISSKDIDLLEQVFNVFGAYSAWGLRNLTHQETPWLEATSDGEKLNGQIDRSTMKKYFTDNYLS